jgi:reactive intermediate/imine deaminase
MSQWSRRDFIGKVGTVVAAGAGATLAAQSASATPAAPQQATPAPVAGRQVIPGSPYPTFSRAVRLDRLVFVAGVVGQKPGTRELVADGFEPQCRQALENLKASVEAAGSHLDKVLKCTVYLTDAADFAAFNKVYVEYFPKDPPARSSVVVKELVVPGAKLEVDCVTYVE